MTEIETHVVLFILKSPHRGKFGALAKISRIPLTCGLSEMLRLWKLRWGIVAYGSQSHLNRRIGSKPRFDDSL